VCTLSFLDFFSFFDFFSFLCLFDFLLCFLSSGERDLLLFLYAHMHNTSANTARHVMLDNGFRV
jgi:hypothetical protein